MSYFGFIVVKWTNSCGATSTDDAVETAHDVGAAAFTVGQTIRE